MHYPVMTERQVAARWKLSLKTLRRWRLDKEGPIWHKGSVSCGKIRNPSHVNLVYSFVRRFPQPLISPF